MSKFKWADELKANGIREIDKQWLYKKISADSAEIYLADQLNEGINYVIGINENLSKRDKEWADEKWNMLKPKIKDGDEIWLYSTPEKYWQSLLGEKGLLIIRNCTIIGNIIPIQN